MGILIIPMVLSVMIGIGCSKKNEDISVIAPVAPTALPSVPAVPSLTVTPTVEPIQAQTLANSPQSDANLPQSDTNYVTDEMYQKALLSEGNLARLAAVMRKAQKGEEITVGVIGGSITAGCLATSPDQYYATLFEKWWVKAFPKTKVNLINAGLGGTTSYLGVHRVQRDLLDKKPDVVVVEFSVNDSDTLFYKETYEDLVRRILGADNNPAVLLLFMTQENGTSAQTSDLLVGFRYDLPRISYREMVLTQIQNASFTWEDISPDDIHPNDKGHAMIGEVLWRYLNQVYAKLNTITDEITPVSDIKPFFAEAYTDAAILDSKSIQPDKLGSFTTAKINSSYLNDWTTSSGGDSIVFDTEAQNIGIMFQRTIDGKSGQFEVYVDGTYVYTLDADFSGGWGNCIETTEVYRSDTKVKHTIEIKKSATSTGDIFTILGLLIS
jgi:lysophospholipase L1-like esterase